MTDAFKIGTTSGGVTALSALTTSVPDPNNEFYISADSITLASGLQRSVGLPRCVWHWGFLTAAQRTQLRTFCTGKSANIFIMTLDDSNTYDLFSAVMVWQESEVRRNGRVIDFSIEFRNLVAV